MQYAFGVRVLRRFGPKGRRKEVVWTKNCYFYLRQGRKVVVVVLKWKNIVVVVVIIVVIL